MSQTKGSNPQSPPHSVLPEKRKTSSSSGSSVEGSRGSKRSKPAAGTSSTGSGREWNDRGEGTGMPSQSPQESQGHPVDRGHGIEKSRSRSVSPANGLEARERAHKISSPQSMAGEKTPGERERHKDPKHHRTEHDKRRDKDRDDTGKRSRRESRDPERRRGSETSLKEAGEITDDRHSRGEHKRQKTEHRHRSRPRLENGRESVAASRLPLPPKARSPQVPQRLAGLPEDVRQAALQAQLRRQAALALEKTAPEIEAERDGGGASIVRGKHSPIVWGSKGRDNSSPAANNSKSLTAAERAAEEVATFQRSQADLGYDPSSIIAMKASPSGSESEKGEIKVSSPGRQQQEGEEGDIAPPMVVRSRWHVDDEEEDGLIADGQVGVEDHLAALNSHEQKDLELAKEMTEDHEAEDDDEKLSAFQRTRPPINMLNSARRVECFERLNTISEGTYGIVHRARDKETGTICALKKIKMDREKDGFPITSIREINILLCFHHRNIVDVSEVVVGSSLDDIFMVMEFMEHDLKGLMDDMVEPFTVAETKNLMLQLLTGMAFLHDNWVLHRDLKTSNILYNNEGQLKICDFGMARQYGSPLRPYTHEVVTLHYRCIELLLGAKKYSTAVDIWSLGCIMAELLTKKTLFGGNGELDQIDKIFKILGSPNEEIWPGYKELGNVQKLKLREQRRTIREILPAASRYDANSGLTEAGFDLIERMLALDPKQRISAEHALKHPWFQELPRPKDPALMPTFPTNKDGSSRNARQRKKGGGGGDDYGIFGKRR